MRAALILSTLFLCIQAAAAAESLYARRPAPLAVEASGGEAGTLVAGTPVTLVERRGERLLVRLDAWHPEGNPAVLYERPGKRIVAAMPKPALLPQLHGGDAVADETGQPWRRVSLTAWAAETDLTADLSAVWAEAEAIFATRCTVCHPRRVPARYTANQLFGFLQAMAPRANLTRDQRMLVLKYLQSQAKDAPPTGMGN
jgi:hypothetical protein